MSNLIKKSNEKWNNLKNMILENKKTIYIGAGALTSSAIIFTAGIYANQYSKEIMSILLKSKDKLSGFVKQSFQIFKDFFTNNYGKIFSNLGEFFKASSFFLLGVSVNHFAPEIRNFLHACALKLPFVGQKFEQKMEQRNEAKSSTIESEDTPKHVSSPNTELTQKVFTAREEEKMATKADTLELF